MHIRTRLPDLTCVSERPGWSAAQGFSAAQCAALLSSRELTLSLQTSTRMQLSRSSKICVTHRPLGRIYVAGRRARGRHREGREWHRRPARVSGRRQHGLLQHQHGDRRNYCARAGTENACHADRSLRGRARVRPHQSPRYAALAALSFGFAWGFGALWFGKSVHSMAVSMANSL